MGKGSMASVLEVLVEARSLIDSPDKWCQGSLQRDGAYCISGALSMAITGSPYKVPLAHPAFSLVRNVTGYSSHEPSFFNDTHSHKEVMAVFDKAIALAKTEEEG